MGAQAGLLPYGDPELFVPFLEDKSTGLWLLPLLPPPQAHNGVYPIYNAEPSSGHTQRNDCKNSDQGIVHGSTGLPFSMVSDDDQPTTTTRASTSATFNQEQTELLNNHHCLGHISIKRARSLDIAGFTLFSLTHTSIDMHSSCRIPLLCDCLSIWCKIWATKCLQIWHLRVLLFPPKSL